MEAVKAVAEFFFVSLAFGVGIFSVLVDTYKTGAGFIRLISAVTGVSAVLGMAFHLSYAASYNPQALCYYVAIVTSLLIYIFHDEEKSWQMWFLYGVKNLALLILMFFFHNMDGTVFLFFLSSSLFLGIVSYAMILGHWYLVVPKLSEGPLKKAVAITWVILGIKVLATAGSLIYDYDFFTEGSRLGAGYMFNWIMLTMRVGWGYLVIGIMSVFAWKLVNMRSIQSGTGMLYAMTFFVLTGELVSQYLYFNPCY